jgi:flavin reductase (DIM6/NTAB) family NADH-FMN oxidoreductase RutF
VKHKPTFRKKDYPVSEIRRYLEPGPVVLVSSAWKENTNIMTMGWHMVLEFSPSLVACCISNANRSFEMIRRSQECMINVSTCETIFAQALGRTARAVVGFNRNGAIAIKKLLLWTM